MTRNVVRQPIIPPITRPRGTPSTIAMVVPVASRPSACAVLPGGATRTASEAVIDQNTAWAKAMPVRLTSNTSKLQATPESRWLPINSRNNQISSLRRSILRVSSISGSEASATIQAYTVSISPTCAVDISKLAPISLSRPTGANSVVLKINAASVSARTLSQLPLGVAVCMVVMEVNELGGNKEANHTLDANRHRRKRKQG